MTPIYQWLLMWIGIAIYVWSARGENVCAQKLDGKLDPEGWIRDKETSEDKAEEAIKLFRKRLAAGLNPVVAFDCSGLIVCLLRALGILSPGANRNSRGLYAMCNSHPKRSELKHGDLVFRAKDTSDPETIFHVGIYVGNGKVVESKGRAYGVVETDINDYAWNMYGRINKLTPFTEPISEPQPEPEPEPEYPDAPLPVAVCKPALRGEGYKALQRAYNLLGYKDADGCLLVEDGVCGKKTRQAADSFIAFNLGAVSADVTVRIEGVGSIGLKTGREGGEEA